MTTTPDNPLFKRWAHLYDTALGSPAEQAAYEAYSLSEIDRRGRGRTAPMGAGPAFRRRLRRLQVRSALRRMRPTLVTLTLLACAYFLAFLTFPSPHSGGLSRALFGLSFTAIPLLFGVLLIRLTSPPTE